MSILDLIEREMGERVNPRSPTTPTTVGATAVQLMPQNPQRVAFILINLSTATIHVIPEGTASSTNGIRLGPNGGQISVQYKEDFTLPALEWSIVADAAGAAFLLIEIELA